MKKAIIPVFVLALFALAVIAIEEGQIITQQQLDNQNISAYTHHDLECVHHSRYTQQQHVKEPFSCLLIEPRYNRTNFTGYEVVRGNFSTSIPLPRIFRCLDHFNESIHNSTECRARYWNEARRQALDTVELIKEHIASFQTQPEFSGWNETIW